jgi:hypothetical protein
MESCDQAWSQLEQRDWERWHGLPERCTWDGLTSTFTPKFEGTIGGHLGTTRTPAARQDLVVEGFARPVRAWERDGAVVFVEVDATEADQSLPERLGEPGGALDYYFMTTKHEGGALVYPDKGLALLSNADRSTVIKILLFSSTSLEAYDASVHHPVEPARRLKR